MTSAAGSQLSSEMQRCIQLCTECSNTCQQTVAYCLQLGGQHAEINHIRLLLDCAELCRTCDDMMLRGSPSAAQVCGVCATVCQQCAESCERVGSGDARLKACADLCRRCADSCRQMAA